MYLYLPKKIDFPHARMTSKIELISADTKITNKNESIKIYTPKNVNVWSCSETILIDEKV